MSGAEEGIIKEKIYRGVRYYIERRDDTYYVVRLGSGPVEVYCGTKNLEEAVKVFNMVGKKVTVETLKELMKLQNDALNGNKNE